MTNQLIGPGSPWSTATVVAHDGDGRIATFDDGRRLSLPVPGYNSKGSRFPTYRFAIGRRPRFIEMNDAVVAVAAPIRTHDVDLAIMSALGVDVEEGMDIHRHTTVWIDFERRDDLGVLIHLGPNIPRHVMEYGFQGRLTGKVHLGEDASYDEGIFTFRMRIPETAVATLVGMPLQRVAPMSRLSHLHLPILRASSKPSPAGLEWLTKLDVCDEKGWRSAE